MRIRKLTFLTSFAAAVLLGLGQTAFAQRFTLTSSAGDTLRQGDILTLTYAFENVSAASFSPPEIEGLMLRSGPSRRSQISIVNGVRSSAEALTYHYEAVRAGSIEIPAVQLDAAAGSLRTETVRIYVTSDPSYVSRPSLPTAEPATPQSPAPPPATRRRATVKM